MDWTTNPSHEQTEPVQIELELPSTPTTVTTHPPQPQQKPQSLFINIIHRSKVALIFLTTLTITGFFFLLARITTTSPSLAEWWWHADAINLLGFLFVMCMFVNITFNIIGGIRPGFKIFAIISVTLLPCVCFVLLVTTTPSVIMTEHNVSTFTDVSRGDCHSIHLNNEQMPLLDSCFVYDPNYYKDAFVKYYSDGKVINSTRGNTLGKSTTYARGKHLSLSVSLSVCLSVSVSVTHTHTLTHALCLLTFCLLYSSLPP
jgi:hypothetical protein